MEHGIKLVLFYWLNDKSRVEDVKKVLAGMAAVEQAKEVVVGEPSKLKDDLIDDSYDVSVEITFESLEEFPILFNSPEHQAVGALCQEIGGSAKAYTIEF